MKLEYGSAKPFTRAHADARDLLPANKHRLRVRVYAALLALDCLAIILAFLAADALRSGPPSNPGGFNIVAVLLPLYLVFAAQRGIYGGNFFHNWRRTARNAVAALAAAVLAVLFVGFYLKASSRLSREVFTVGLVLSIVALVLHRWLLHRWTNRMWDGEWQTQLVICDGIAAPDDHPGISVSAELLELTPDINDPRALDRIGRLLKRADRVVIACPDERRAAWAAVLKGANLRGEILSPELAELGTLGAGSFATQPTLVVSLGPLDTRNRALKRALDLALALMATGVLAPLMIAAAIAIRLDSPGPVFFVQRRLGRGNRLFSMYKFRSMRTELCDAEGNQSTQRADDRVTRVGRIIRATSIDELPQILNVITGDMSIVGPRPHALGSLAGDKLFWEVDQRYWHRHAAKPGITGLAQVKGFRGATHLQSDLADRLQADLDYLNDWTIWRDLRILVATFKVVLHRNAY